jgi:hypothetical protein
MPPAPEQTWRAGLPIAELARQPVRVAASTSMRDALAIRHHTGHALWIEEGGELAGVVDDDELRGALVSMEQTSS